MGVEGLDLRLAGFVGVFFGMKIAGELRVKVPRLARETLVGVSSGVFMGFCGGLLRTSQRRWGSGVVELVSEAS